MSYSMPERSVMLVLMALNREVSNKELKDKFKIDMKAPARKRLNGDGLVESRKDGRSFAHRLTDKGWAWAKTELSQPAPPRSGSTGAALYAVLNALGSGLDRQGLTLVGLFASGATGRLTIADQIKAAYRRLAKRSQDWVYLSELRPLLYGATRAEVDSALKDMYRGRSISLTLEEDQKSLTAAQRAAAIRVGVDDLHLIAME